MRLLRNLAAGAAALTFLTLATQARAATLTLQEVVTFHQFQQTSNRPCVIGDNSCTYLTPIPIPPQSDAIFPDSGGSVDITSAQFYVGTIRSLIGNTFWMGFDVNQSNVPQTIDYFAMYINGNPVPVDSWDTIGAPATTVPTTIGGGNGTGYADYLFTGFTSLAAYDLLDIVTFRAILPLTNDGREQFFLIAAAAPRCPDCNDDPLLFGTPEPATLVLFGTGLAALAVAVRRRRNAQG